MLRKALIAILLSPTEAVSELDWLQVAQSSATLDLGPRDFRRFRKFEGGVQSVGAGHRHEPRLDMKFDAEGRFDGGQILCL